MALVAAVAVTVAVMVGVEAETEHSESVSAIVVVLAVEVLVDEVAVAGSFAGEPEDVGVAPVEGAELAAPAVAVHSERPESPVEHSEFDLDFVDTHDESAVQDDMTEVAVVVFGSAAVEHEEDNRPASAAGEAQAGVQARWSAVKASTLQTVSQRVF